MKLILCPLKSEWAFLSNSLTQSGVELIKKQNQGKWFYEIPELEAYLCIGGHGKVDFALGAQFWCHYFNDISLIFTAGAAGSLSSDLKVGDVLWVDEIIEHDYKEKFDSNAKLPSFKLERQSTVSTFKEFQITSGILASGDEDIVTAERANQLAHLTGAQAVAWESAGGVRAARSLNIPYQEIRGITDLAQGDVAQDFLKNLEKVMHHCAQVILQA